MAPRNGLPAIPLRHRTLEVSTGAISGIISASRLPILIPNARCPEPSTFFSYPLFLVSLITNVFDAICLSAYSVQNPLLTFLKTSALTVGNVT